MRRNSGFFSIASTCPSCNGEGEIVEKPCTACRGTGVVRRTRTITVTIPAGIEDGKRLSLSGQGDGGTNGARDGDLYIFLRVQPHELYEREGNDVYCAVPISFTQAALGADIAVSTLDSKVARVSVPAGTQNGRILRLKGEGIPELHNPSRRGDMYVKLIVRVPTKVSARAKELLKELATVSGEEKSPKPIPLSELKQ